MRAKARVRQSLFLMKKNKPSIDRPELLTQPVSIALLKPAEYNPRKFTPKEYQDLKESIERFGIVSPIVVNSAPARKNVVIGGHFRLKVAKDLGMAEVPVLYVNLPDMERERELNLRLNKNLGEWDFDLLAKFNESVLVDAGFESVDLDRIFDAPEFEDDFNGDEAYERSKNVSIRPGDVIELGRHRLFCGSATDPEQVKKFMGGGAADMVFTDPPYNVDYKGTGKKTSRGINNDDMAAETFVKFSEGWAQSVAENLKPGGAYYICSGYSSFPTFVYALRAQGILYFSQPIIWVKDMASHGWSDYKLQHEMILKGKSPRKRKAEAILYGWKNGRHYFGEMETEADVWHIKRRAPNTMVHPTQKPMDLVKRAIMNSSRRGETVLDLFGGSGTTLVAAAATGRRCFIMDNDPTWCEVIRKRWQNFSSQKAAA